MKPKARRVACFLIGAVLLVFGAGVGVLGATTLYYAIQKGFRTTFMTLLFFGPLTAWSFYGASQWIKLSKTGR